jgi:predicted RNase H-like nuclease (RuvC/YqgF family)
MIMNNIKIAKKKPIEIEVIQITGTDENIKEIQNFCGRWSFYTSPSTPLTIQSPL